MKYNQKAVDDLLSPLRYVNLKDIDPNSINRIGEGVFPELTTLDHLSILDLVTKAYQAVHMPTLGHSIPQSTVLTTATLQSSATAVTLVTASANEVIEIIGISVAAASNYETGGVNLNISKDGTTYPFINLAAFDTFSASATTNVVYGKMVKPAQGYVSLTDLYINGGDSLVLTSATNPNDDIVFQIVYRKVVQ